MSTVASEETVRRLRAAGCVFAEDEARLLHEAADASGAGAELDRLVARRVSGEPLEQVLGWAELSGVRVAIEPGVFVPRRRTELVVREAVGAARTAQESGHRPVVVDLCCGSGAVAAAVHALMAADVPGDHGGPELHAADVDPVAVRLAERNVPGEVHLGDLFDALPRRLAGRVDVLAVNAPYVPSGAIATMPPEARLHEPGTALDGGPDGLDVHRRVAAGARDWLAPHGCVVLETSVRQAAGTVAALEAGGLRCRVVRDDEVDGTVVVGTAVDDAAEPPPHPQGPRASTSRSRNAS